MALNKKLIHFKNKEKFNEELANGNILETSIVFILDTTEIYTHGLLYDGSKVDLSKLEEAISKIKTDGNGFTYLNDKGEYEIPLIIVNSEEELNALNVPEGTEAIVIYPEATYTEEEFNNSEYIQSTVSHITIDGFDTSKVLTNTYTSSGLFGVPCRSSKGINYNEICISYNELGITTIFLNEVFDADQIIYGSNTWYETASDVYDFEMGYLTTLSEEQLVIFLDVIGSEYKYKSFSYAIKYVYCNSGWTNPKLVFNSNSMCNISELIPYYKSILGNPNVGEVIHVGTGILLGASLIDGYYRSFNGETIEKYEVSNAGNWFSLNPIESYRILTEKDVNVSIPTLTDGKVPIEQLPLTTTGDGTQFLSDNGNYKELNIPTKVSQLENDANYILDDVVSDGVYAVDANGKLIDYNTADSSCLGVALVAGEHKFMIAKSDATDGTNTTLYWSKNYSDLSLTNYNTVDGTNSYGFFRGIVTPKLNKDFTTWTAGALSDFNGKANTEVIAAASSSAKEMCTALNTFNQTEQTAGRSADWYVPACGQLALMYLNPEINAALAKIGGTALAAGRYWSSSEGGANGAWVVDFSDGYVDDYSKDFDHRVRFVRDISVKPLKERVSDLELNKYTKPTDGIPKTDLASAVLTSLGKADTALLSIPSEYITETELAAKGYTTNIGTITGIKMNGASKGTSGIVDLGTVITSHQDISGKAPIASPTFTGIPKAPTAAKDTNTTQVATTAFVQEALPTALKNPNTLTIGSQTYDGSSKVTITAADLGLSSALKYHGTTTTALTDGATTKPIVIGGSNHNQEQGCVVAYNNSSFVWTGSAWEELGNPGNYKVIQNAVSSPSASGNALAFIDTISLDANGTITATKKNVLTASTSVYGVTKLSSATNSASEDIAATPKAVKTAYDLASSKWTYNADTIKAVKVNTASTADVANSVNWTNVNNKPTNLSQFTDDVVAGKYLPLSGGTMNGDVVWKAGTGHNSILPGHIYRNLHGSTGDIYDHYYPIAISSTNTFANLRVFSSSSNTYRTLRFGGDGTFTWDGNTIIHSGNIGSQSVNYATSAGNATNALNTKHLVYNEMSPNVSLGMGEIAYSLVPASVAGNLPVKYNANGVLTLNTHQGNYYYQLGFSSNGNIYGRFSEGYELSDNIAWKLIAFTDSDITGNAATASALTALSSTDDASVSDGRRKIWMSYLDGTTGRPALSSNLTFRTDTNTLYSTNFSGNLTGNVRGSLVVPRASSMYVTDVENNTLAAFQLNPENRLLIGQDTTKKGIETIIYGNQISFAYGNAGSSSNTALYISPSGNVGIGTTNPTEKLHVDGNVKVENGNFIGNLTGTADNSNAVNGTKIAIVSLMPSSPDSSTLYFVK